MDLNVDFKKLATLFLSAHKRKNRRVRFLYALLKPFRDIHINLLSYVTSVKEDMNWNGQKVLLERYLNLTFGSGIVITNYDFALKQTLGYPCPDYRNVIGYEATSTDGIIGYGATDGFLSAPGFKVEVPAAIQFDEKEMRAKIESKQIGASEFEIVVI